MFSGQKTSLSRAAGYEKVKTTILLVDHDANLRTTDGDGWTLFHSRS
jgi:hypothetical protein